MEIVPTAVDLRDLLSTVGQLMGPVAEKKGLRFAIDTAPGVPEWICVDPVRVRQVLLNLAGNAIKFTAEGSVTLSVRAPEPGQLEFAVADTGIGIPAEKCQRIFEPFEQADGTITRQYAGTGLGLSISKNLVELMEGTIQLQSELGRGSVFTFRIPAPAAAAPREVPASAIDTPGAPLRILVAEDNAVNQKLIAALLARDGHQADVVSSGRLAVEAVRTAGAPYDLVLMDIQMPELDGFEATRLIRSIGGEAPPIVALTAHAQTGYGDICRAAGMEGYLTKPIDRLELRRELARFSPRPASAEAMPAAIAP